MDPNNQTNTNSEPLQSMPNTVIDNVKPAGAAPLNRPAVQAPPTMPVDKPTPAPESGQPLKQPAVAKKPAQLPSNQSSHNSPAIVVIMAIIVIILLLAVAVFAYMHSQNISTK